MESTEIPSTMSVFIHSLIINRPNITSKRSTPRKNLDNALFVFLFFCFLLQMDLIQLVAIFLDRYPQNYLAADSKVRGRSLFFISFHFVTPQKRRLYHFCIALTVTRKFRLCLHPHRMLRVQSLHLPLHKGLARRFLFFNITA